MSGQRASYFALLLEKSENPVGICTSLMLAFMAQADGILTAEERTILESAAEQLLPGENEGRKAAIIEELTAIAAGNRIDDMVLACRTLQRTATPADRELILDLLIGMIVSDNRVNLAERYILEFIVDLFDLTPDELNDLYKQNTGKDMPAMGDPSSRSWWEVRSQRQQRYDQHDAHTAGRKREPVTITEAYNVLGVHTGASSDEIHTAYRRMAMRHHPDRFQSLGDEAVQRATLTFTHVQKAYELLRTV